MTAELFSTALGRFFHCFQKLVAAHLLFYRGRLFNHVIDDLVLENRGAKIGEGARRFLVVFVHFLFVARVAPRLLDESPAHFVL